MSQFDPNEYVTLLMGAGTLEEVDAAFDKIAELPEADAKQAVDAIEASFSEHFMRGLRAGELAQMKMVLELIEQAKDTPQGKLIRAQLDSQGGELLEEGRAISQIVLRVHEAKGDTASAFTKAYVAEAAKLSDEEYGTGYGILKVMVGVADKMLAESKPAPANPFRKPSAPKGPAA